MAPAAAAEVAPVVRELKSRAPEARRLEYPAARTRRATGARSRAGSPALAAQQWELLRRPVRAAAAEVQLPLSSRPGRRWFRKRYRISHPDAAWLRSGCRTQDRWLAVVDRARQAPEEIQEQQKHAAQAARFRVQVAAGRREPRPATGSLLWLRQQDLPAEPGARFRVQVVAEREPRPVRLAARHGFRRRRKIWLRRADGSHSECSTSSTPLQHEISEGSWSKRG